LTAKSETMSPGPRAVKLRDWLSARLITLSYVYFTCLLFWTILRFFFQDRWSWLFLVSGFAPYLFLPLPIILLVAFVTRKRVVWLGSGLSLLLWFVLYGGLYLPSSHEAQENGTVLTVMTYNVLGFNSETEAEVVAIRASGADLVGLTELAPDLALEIEEQLSDIYPYQVLAPQPGVSGMGMISRYPIHDSGETLPTDSWIGAPQILQLDIDGVPATILHFHAIPLATSGRLSGLMWSVSMPQIRARLTR